jgi:hypothetical protein
LVIEKVRIEREESSIRRSFFNLRVTRLSDFDSDNLWRVIRLGE